MGLLDKIKGLFKGRESQVKSGIDTASNKVESRVGPKHADKVDDVSQKAKDFVDSGSGTGDASPVTPPTTTPPTTTPPASGTTPPATGTPPPAV